MQERLNWRGAIFVAGLGTVIGVSSCLASPPADDNGGDASSDGSGGATSGSTDTGAGWADGGRCTGGFRLPTAKELVTLVDVAQPPSRYDSAIST
jgi:hypothetical protein